MLECHEYAMYLLNDRESSFNSKMPATKKRKLYDDFQKEDLTKVNTEKAESGREKRLASKS